MDFNRPGISRLIEDAKDGKIALILCKDLSRFGRNYIQVRQFTDYLFPMIGVRFIVLNDGVDTNQNDNYLGCYVPTATKPARRTS